MLLNDWPLVRRRLRDDLLRLPPVVIVFGYDLEDIANRELDTRLSTRYQVVVFRIVDEKSFHVNLDERERERIRFVR